LVLCQGISAQELQLRIDDIVAPNFRLQGIVARVSLTTPAALNLSIEQATFQGREWRKLALHCPKARIERDLIACPKGLLEGVPDSGEKIPLSFQYWPAQRSLELVLQPAADERWQAALNWRSGKLAASVQVANGKAVRFNDWLPGQGIRFGQGALDLRATLESQDATRNRIDVAVTLRNVAFSDAAGSHAGEKLDGAFSLQAEQADTWRWRAKVDWRAGEVFWQPFYFAPGVRSLSAQGTLSAQQAVVEQAALTWPGIGTVAFNGAWDRKLAKFEQFALSGKTLALDELYRTFLKPIAPAGMLRSLALSGSGSGQLRFQQGALQEATLTIQQGGIRHETKEFSLAGIDADLAWHRQQARDNRLSVSGAKLGKLDLGAFRVDAALAPQRITVAPLRIPILDGALSVESVAARLVDNNWQWSLSAAVQPISMQALSKALQLPTMHGTLSGVIPQVRYARQSLQVDGALLFKVFDGTVVVKDLSASDLLGPTPHVYGNIDMRNLDMDLLTQTFSFGSMQGRLDVTVSDLEIFGWKPVRFDAKVASSPGDYPRKISQRAVQNITALGGGGGVAALQRSFLRFFDQFGYQRLGLSCRLTYGVCEMGGVAEAPTGYVIVQGGGIPALTVIGYNRRVDWDELLARIQRATQGGKPIVQ
jgi:hypothetical protein